MNNKKRLFLLVPLLLVLHAAGCTGVTDQQLQADQKYSVARDFAKKVTVKQREFENLVSEFHMSGAHVYLDKMGPLIEEMKNEAALVEPYLSRFRYYPKGLSYFQWEEAQFATGLYRKTLGEMMLKRAELNMLFGDRQLAEQTFQEIIDTFNHGKFDGYVDIARARLKELEAGAGDSGEGMTHSASLSCGQ